MVVHAAVVGGVHQSQRFHLPQRRIGWTCARVDVGEGASPGRSGRLLFATLSHTL